MAQESVQASLRYACNVVEEVFQNSQFQKLFPLSVKSALAQVQTSGDIVEKS